MLLARCLDKRGQGHEVFVADYTQAFLNAEVHEREQLYAQPPEGWTPKLLTCGVEGAQSHARLANISKAMAGTPFKQVERPRVHSR